MTETKSDPRLAEVRDRMSLAAVSVPSKYRSAIKAANTQAEAYALGERIRDETLRELDRIRDSLPAEKIAERKRRLLRGEGRIPFLERFPTGHAHAGRIRQRQTQCSCGASHWQYAVSAAWVASLEDGARASFLESCVVDSEGSIWQPGLCTNCARQSLRETRP